MSSDDWGVLIVSEFQLEGLPTRELHRLLQSDRVEPGQLNGAVDRLFAGLESLQDPSPQLDERIGHLEEALESYQEGGPKSVLVEALDALFWSRLATGPSQFDVVNVFRNLWSFRDHPELPADVWASARGKALGFYREAVEEVSSSGLGGRPVVQKRMRALKKVVAHLEELGESPIDPEAILGPMQESLMQLQLAVEAYGQELVEGPTGVAAVNQVYQAAGRVREGALPAEVLESCTHRLIDRVESALRNLELAAKLSTETLTPKELEKTAGVLEGLDRALGVILRFSTEGCPEPELNGALETLVQAGHYWADLENHLENRQAAVCAQCGHRNPPESRLCSECQAQLPRLRLDSAESSFQLVAGEEGVESSNVTTPALEELAQACLDLEAGTLAFDRFQSLVARHLADTEKVESRLSDLRLPLAPAEAPESVVQVVEFGHQSLDSMLMGLGDCIEGLETMARAAEEADPAALRQGLRLYSEGTQMLWRARRAYELATGEPITERS